MTLEQAIQHHDTGKLRLTVFPISSGYQASMAVDGKSFRVEMAPDALTAVEKVLGLRPGATGQMLPADQPEPGAFD